MVHLITRKAMLAVLVVASITAAARAQTGPMNGGPLPVPVVKTDAMQ